MGEYGGGETLRGSNERPGRSPATRGEENYDNLRTRCPPSLSPPDWTANSREYPSQGSETDKEKALGGSITCNKDTNAR